MIPPHLCHCFFPSAEHAIPSPHGRRYQKAYNDYARALHTQFPKVKFNGAHYDPGPTKVLLSQILQGIFFGGLAVSLVGRSLLPEPWSKFLEANQMPILGACFFCNIAAGNLLNSGAFEISYDGAFVWSKIESGRFPQMDELKTALAAVM